MSERYLIAVDSCEVVLFGRPGSRSLSPVRMAVAEPTPAALADACSKLLEQTGVRSGSANVWLGSAWARLLMLDWPDVWLDRDEREALLRHRWADVLPDPERWLLMVSDRGSPRLGVAIREGVAEALAQVLSRAGMHARSLLPAVCGALDAAGIRDGAVLLDEGDRLVVARCDAGCIVALAVRRQIAGEPGDSPTDFAGIAGKVPPQRLGGPAGGAAEWGALWR